MGVLLNKTVGSVFMRLFYWGSCLCNGKLHGFLWIHDQMIEKSGENTSKSKGDMKNLKMHRMTYTLYSDNKASWWQNAEEETKDVSHIILYKKKSEMIDPNGRTNI